jgi:AcrR family transcriptional regulator
MPSSHPFTETQAVATHEPGVRDRRREATRETVLDAAIELFSEHGCEGTTMRDIALRSGVKPPLIVYHFGSKENLWKAAVDEVWRRMESTLAERMGEHGLPADEVSEPARTRDDLRVILRSFLESVARHPAYLRILLREGSHRGPRFQWLCENHTRRNYEAGVRLFEAAKRSGALPEVPTDHLLFILSGALTFSLAIAEDVRAHTGKDPRSSRYLDDHIETLMTLLLSGATSTTE